VAIDLTPAIPRRPIAVIGASALRNATRAPIVAGGPV
jgi:hypothetical protein